MAEPATSGTKSVDAQRAREDDRQAVIDIISESFFDDPTWSWAFPDPERRGEHYAAWWDLFVGSAIPHEWVWLTGDGASAAVWIPPGKPELSEEDDARMEPLLRELVGDDHADDVLDLIDLFDVTHPQHEPHYYLSLLGTRTDCRGRGSGLGLLADALARIDAVGLPAYLEASNPANVDLYERFGFFPIGEFSVEDSPTVTGMWREPQFAIDTQP